MQGCPACEEFLPRLKRAANRSGLRLNVYDVDKSYGKYLADTYKVKATPTMLGLTERGTLKRKVGGLSDPDLDDFIAALP